MTVVHGMILGISCIPVESSIVKEASDLTGSSESKIAEAIRKGKHNRDTACYYLLLSSILQNEGKEILDYYIEKQEFIHRYSNI